MGKGFAVVAVEVGQLSEKSSVANSNIEETVKEIVEVVKEMRKA